MSGIHHEPANPMTNRMRAAILFLAAASVIGQRPPAPATPPPGFEVAVIRPSAADAAGTNFMLSSSRFSVTNAPLTDLIQFAYNLKTNQQVPKTPAWIASEKFDVDATIADADRDALKKLPADQKLEQYRLRVRTLSGRPIQFQSVHANQGTPGLRARPRQRGTKAGSSAGSARHPRAAHAYSRRIFERPGQGRRGFHGSFCRLVVRQARR